jgi:hypothetical protein
VKALLSWFASAALLVAPTASCSLLNAPEEVRPGGEGTAGMPCTTDTDCVNSDCATFACQMGTCVAVTDDCPYWASGVQQNVPAEALKGWTECYKGPYQEATKSLDELRVNDCNKRNLLLACRPMGEGSFTLVAMAESAYVFQDCLKGATCAHDANGVGWYFDEDLSWGFAPAGEPVNRAECDNNESSAQDLRMCWHTVNNSLSSGYRCGAVVTDNTAWERVIFHRD